LGRIQGDAAAGQGAGDRFGKAIAMLKIADIAIVGRTGAPAPRGQRLLDPQEGRWGNDS
jgi:hypothetical protein